MAIMQPQKVVISMDTPTRRIMERIADALEKSNALEEMKARDVTVANSLNLWREEERGQPYG